MKKDEQIFLEDGYTGKMFGYSELQNSRVFVGIPMTGLVRSEWVFARYHQVIPCNWSQAEQIQWLDQWSPVNYLVADARNLIATTFVEKKFEWLFFLDHDVMLPPHSVLRMNDRIRKAEIPVWSGLYFTKSIPSEPLVYRGRGTSYYGDWKLGDEVWVDGIPMGCTLIHRSIMQVLYDESEWYDVGPNKAKHIFETPSRTYFDPEKQAWFNATGTEDLAWCSRVMTEGVFEKAGWPEYEKMEYPFMVDTSLFCKHIDFDGRQFPMMGEEKQFNG